MSPATRPCTTTAPSSHRATAAIGGRFGPSRTTSSREIDDAHRTTGARRRARGPRPATGDRRLAAEGAAVGQRRGRLAAGRAPRRVGLEVGGLDPAGGEAHAARHRLRAARAAARDPRWCADPAPCPRAPAPRAASRPRPSPGRPRSSPGPRSRAGEGTATSASRGAASSANPPSPRGTPGPTRWRAPPSSAARRGGGVEIACRRAPRPGAPSIASYTVCQPVHRHRWAARARSRSTRRVLPLASAAATRTMIPGVQNPHCEPPVATNRAARSSRTVPSSPSTVVTARPSTRAAGRDARDARLAVDQHRAAPALALRAHPSFTESTPEALAQHREQRLARVGVDLDLLTVAGELHPMPRSGHGQAG